MMIAARISRNDTKKETPAKPPKSHRSLQDYPTMKKKDFEDKEPASPVKKKDIYHLTAHETRTEEAL